MNAPQGSNPAQDLAAALSELARLRKSKKAPGHRMAREVLVPLGEILLEGTTEGLDATLGEIARLTEDCTEEWAKAVDAELRMAAEEHCASVDPRFLEHPRYDFAYTVSARERLEARLRAIELLGLLVPEDLLDRVGKADEVLEPFLERADRARRDG